MRVRRSTNRKDRRKKILKLAEGYWGGKSRLHRTAKIQVDKSLSTPTVTGSSASASSVRCGLPASMRRRGRTVRPTRPSSRD